MNTLTILTFFVGILTIVVNICIAIYNVGKNRKIYAITKIDTNSTEAVNQQLKNGDYTILYVGKGKLENSTIYILGRLNSGGEK